MKHHLNTLFVTTQGSYLAKEGEAVLVRVEKETKLRVPIHTLGGIVCFGNVTCSPYLMGLCGERGVAVSFMTPACGRGGRGIWAGPQRKVRCDERRTRGR